MNGLPVFSGELPYEESATDVDFASFVVHVAYQMPERSKREFLRGLGKIEEICEYAVNSGNYKLVHMLCDLGFLNIGHKGEENGKHCTE